ncbi:hypothetical protein IEO21_04842 [Rhodonia placenta]|uniref:DNA (cytosine-5-)-methyltransferase n=1 Tax=Rhodonia placenta TaxID=104341 RepID=A0A8H7P309_9APHY|nr:hypothetical protein IEO21_04842 [Postia placenta]
MWDHLLQRRLQPADVDDVVPHVQSILQELGDGDQLWTVPMIRDVLQRARGPGRHRFLRPVLAPSTHRAPAPTNRRTQRALTGNVDLAVLHPENQSRTHVTPLIDKLAVGLFQEHLEVVGAKQPDKRDMAQVEKTGRAWFIKLLERWQKYEIKPPKVEFRPSARIAGDYWKSMKIDGTEYSVGDVIIVPAGPDEERHRKKAVLPSDLGAVSSTATFADYFWFGKIIYIDRAEERVHCQWLEHSSMTMLGVIGDPEELFLCNSCSADNIHIQAIVGKAPVHWGVSPMDLVDPDDFCCRFVYNELDASFISVDDVYGFAAESSALPQNCPVCLLSQAHADEDDCRSVKDGIAYHGATYHVHDFALLANGSHEGPAIVVQILDIGSGSRGSEVLTVRLLGRISGIISICPNNMIKDEQHLFLTDEEKTIHPEQLIRHCSVLHPDAVPVELSDWLSSSPYHFYIKYHFPVMNPIKWHTHTVVQARDILVCSSCYEDNKTKVLSMKNFLQSNPPLKAFDPFGGVGAFGLGLEESGCLKVVQTIEISPSAAQALQENCPHTTVYNQCSNVVLQYAIKNHAGHKPQVPRAIGNGQRALPDPPTPGQIDCIIAGFPCQPHSQLNMFQRADDRKSHLILNLLSWVNFLQPRFCLFENVRGFLSYNLNATQAGRYRVEGGIKMGGLKFLVHSLLAMNYQVRFALLQAAHYGTPQSRIRFFLIAARSGHPLPAFPQPTHDFPLKDSLKLEFTNKGVARPIWTQIGTVPHNYVSVDDAISDLPRFHWSNPRKLYKNHPQQDNDGIPEVACDASRSYCRPPGALDSYHTPPKTSFQVKCRQRKPTDLQQFTRVFKEETVERVVNIPLQPKADYKSLHPDMWEWLFANPASATARDGFHSGLYGRIDASRWFQTTVTKVEPTAKQSWVLNPYCKRMVTVRELARSQGFPDHFRFYSYNDDVKTMHRQIGNAVPFPVSSALGRELREAAFKYWLASRAQAIVVE